MTTDLTLSAAGVDQLFAQCSTIEQLFAVVTNQLAIDSAEVRKYRALLRHAAPCMALATSTEV